MANHVLVYDLTVLLGMLQHVRARAHNGHIVPEDVDELRKLIDTGSSEEVAPLGFTRVILGSLDEVGLVVHLHAAELEAGKLFPVVTATLLLEEHRARHGNLGDDGHDDVNPPEAQHQEEE